MRGAVLFVATDESRTNTRTPPLRLASTASMPRLALEARRAKASAPKEQALLDFTKAVMAKNGCVSDAELAAFRAAGFDNRSEAGELSQARTFEQRAEVLAEDEVFLGKLCSGAVLIEMAEHQLDASHRRPGIVDE